MFFDDERETRKRPKRLNEIQNKFKPAANLKLAQGKLIIAGTESENIDNGVIEILDSPPPPKKSRQIKPAEKKLISLIVDSDDDFSFVDTPHSSSLRSSKQQNKPPPVAVQKASTSKSTTSKQSTSKPSTSGGGATTSKAKSIFKKRTIVSSSDEDDGIQFFQAEPKRPKTVLEVSQKVTQQLPMKKAKAKTPEKKAKEPVAKKKEVQKTTKQATISKQLKTAPQSSSIFGSKRKNEESDDEDDLFNFSKQTVVKPPPLKIRAVKSNTDLNKNKSLSASVSASSSMNNPFDDETLDNKPGREIGSTKWLSNASLEFIKKEGSQSESIDEPDMQSIFNVIPIALNLNESSTPAAAERSEFSIGKSFKKKTNYKPQTTVANQRFIDWKDADLLYAPED